MPKNLTFAEYIAKRHKLSLHSLPYHPQLHERLLVGYHKLSDTAENPVGRPRIHTPARSPMHILVGRTKIILTPELRKKIHMERKAAKKTKTTKKTPAKKTVPKKKTHVVKHVHKTKKTVKKTAPKRKH